MQVVVYILYGFFFVFVNLSHKIWHIASFFKLLSSYLYPIFFLRLLLLSFDCKLPN